MARQKKVTKNNGKIDFQEFASKLENMILTGGFRPRERLVEANLSQMFNVSRYWVRDAFKILETKRLVTVIPFKGVVVSELNEKEIEEIFAIRVVLEQLAVGMAMENMGPGDVDALTAIVEKLEHAQTTADVAGMVEGDSRFHDYIFQLSGNETLRHTINDFRNRCHIIRYSAWSSADILTRVRDEHRLFVKYLAARDKEGLHELARHHISHAKNFYLFRLRAETTMLS